MDNWFNEKIFKWSEILWKNNTIYKKKECIKTLLFDYIPIENYIMFLLHTEIGVGNKIVYS